MGPGLLRPWVIDCEFVRGLQVHLISYGSAFHYSIVWYKDGSGFGREFGPVKPNETMKF